MERLWTPWRREFIEGANDRTKGCFLCVAAAGDDDRANLVIFRAEKVFVLLNKYPYNNGHLMIAPYQHTGDLVSLDPATAAEIMDLTQRSVGILEQAYKPDAFNVGLNLGKAAGAGVPDHLHVHAVPRWNGDTNFMPVLAETKVLPETLEQTFARLEPIFHSGQ